MDVIKKVGIYGGTFDPIHFGHINLALEIKEYHKLDEVWFCPAFINPHKLEIKSADASHRLKMLELALEDLPQFGIIPNEIEREGPSFMVDTLKELIQEESYQADPCQFHLILGADSVKSFFKWKEPLEIIQLAPPLVGTRVCEKWDSLEAEKDHQIAEALRQGETPTRIFQISATEIRSRLKQEFYVGHLLPGKVIDYIYKHHLYS